MGVPLVPWLNVSFMRRYTQGMGIPLSIPEEMIIVKITSILPAMCIVFIVDGGALPVGYAP